MVASLSWERRGSYDTPLNFFLTGDNATAKSTAASPHSHAGGSQPRLQVVQNLGVQVDIPAAWRRLNVTGVVELALVVVAEHLIGLLDVLELGEQLLALLIVGILQQREG